MNTGRAAAGRFWLWSWWAGLALTLLLTATLAPHLRDSAELVRLRNALLLQSPPAEHAWTPARPPAGFAVESAPPTPLYADTVARNALKVEGDDWATALAIGRHLLPAGRRSGGAIQADLGATYVRITAQREGYCGDYADSFTGLATAAGVFARSWAFSFDGYGGRGHIFNEIWDAARARWVMIDVFNNFYVVDGAGQALSAMAFRDALQGNAAGIELVPVDPTAAPGFRDRDKALAYFRRGLPQWYMWWGNNVFEYDRSPVVAAFGKVHRALEQLGGVAVGLHPRIRMLATAEGAEARARMWRLRAQLFGVIAAAALTVIGLIGWLLQRRRREAA